MKMEQIGELIDDAILQTLANLHTVTIAKVVKVNEKTIDCKPVINRVVNGESRELPVFAEVPPIMLGGAANYMKFPVNEGDYALLLFTERCFDRWYNGQDFQEPPVFRMHDYSDGFALVGLRNFSQLLTIPTELTIAGNMRLGCDDPGDYVALAQKVLDELNAVKQDITVLKAATSTGIGAIVPPPAGATAKTAFDGATASIPHTPQSVASAKIKAE